MGLGSFPRIKLEALGENIPSDIVIMLSIRWSTMFSRYIIRQWSAEFASRGVRNETKIYALRTSSLFDYC